MLKRLLHLTRNKEIVTYLIFGVLTTAVNWIVCFLLLYKFDFSAALSSAIAWFIAVLFAFFTNKPFVFQSHDWSAGVVVREILNFFGSRLISGLLETGILALMVDYLRYNGVTWKLIASVIVVILNYLFSKLFIFRKQ